MTKKSLFELVGGFPTLEKVHKVFYDKVYAHPWLGKFFADKKQEFIELRQTQFMAEKMGGNIKYPGRDPQMAHRAFYITEELFELRTRLLVDALKEVGVADEHIARWIKIDNAFKGKIVKESIASFYATSWKYEKRIIIPKPTSR